MLRKMASGCVPPPSQNKLREEDIQRIVDTYDNYQVIDKYSYVASRGENKENYYNLNIPRYVDTFKRKNRWIWMQ